MLGHKTNVNKCKKIEIISNMLSDHNGMKLDLSYMEKLQTYESNQQATKQPISQNKEIEEIKNKKRQMKI